MQATSHSTEAIVNKSEIEFRRLLEKLPAAAYTCDVDGLITYYNQHAVRLWGRAPKRNDPADRFCGSFKLFAADGSPIAHADCWMAKALQENREYNGHEIQIERPAGDRLTALAHANPIHDEAGKLVGAVNVLVDISDRKQAEAAVLAANEQLREADRRKDEFLAMLAHELRNPLAPLRNSLEILKLSDETSPAAVHVRGIMERQVNYMVRLVDDLLEVSRITRGKIELRKEPVELVSIIRGAVETSRPAIDAAGHQLAITVSPESILLEADAMRLAQVISNLLNNAAKYTAPGGQIWLTCRREGDEAIVSVKDTGLGISSEMLERVFEMFVQADDALKQSQGGLGIGLTLAKNLVNLHGGRIEAHSAGLGLGSEFIVRLPLALASHVEQRTSFSEGNCATSKFRIIVADDNVDAAETLATMLRIMGHELRTAQDGVEALEMAAAFRPDVILLDIGMPRMNGYDVAIRIRQQPAMEGMTLIALTGWDKAEHKRRAIDSGFDYHMAKPVDIRIVERVLRELPARAVSVQP